MPAATANSESSPRRVVITGVGVISPIGIGRETFAAAVLAGDSGIGPLELMDYTGMPSNVGAEVLEFTESAARKEYLRGQRKFVKMMCREIQMGVSAAMLCLADSEIDPKAIDQTRFGVDFGANQMFSHPLSLCRGAALASEGDEQIFRFARWGQTGMTGMYPLWLLKYLPNMPACHIGIAADARGPNNSLTHGEASGNLAIGEASRVISRGSADIMIAGSTGSRLHPIHCIHAKMWEELAEEEGDPSEWCRPFDARRTGQVIGEGACAFLLEAESYALARGATILGTIRGAGSSCVADRDGTPRPRKAIVNALHAALADAGVAAAEIGHIHAHGIGTRRADAEEAAAIREVFGEATDEIPVTALKSALGNSGAGSGSLELAGSLLALREGVVPRTLNYSDADPDCPLDVVHDESRPVSNPLLVNISVTAHGQASTLVVEVA